MAQASDDPASRTPADLLRRAQEHVFLIIDPHEVRAQKLASLLTMAGLRAIVTANTYQAFNRFLQERFVPRVILIGQQEETTTPLFGRFFQRLVQELRIEPPTLSLASFYLNDGQLLIAEGAVSSTTHIASPANSFILRKIWQTLPSAQISLQVSPKSIALHTLPKLGFSPRVTRNKRSFSSHLHLQLKAAKKVIPPEQWENVMTDVGLAQFVKEESWPPLIDQFSVPPEQFSLLTHAVMFANAQQPLQQLRLWADQVEADAYQKAALIFIMQQIPKVIGSDLTMRALLNVLTTEVDSRRGEKLTEWKRLEDGSFFFVFYSNIFAYGKMGFEHPLCYMWQATFDLMLRLSKQQQQWSIREIECSAQSHTGHCIFQISPKKRRP